MAGSSLVQSLSRALDILEAVGRAESQAGSTLVEITRNLGLKPATAHNLAKTLIARGYLERPASGAARGYRLGRAAGELGEMFHSRAFAGGAEAAVRGLSERFPSATVVFAESAGPGGEVHYRLRMSPERPGVLERPRALAVHPYGTACGLLFQALWTGDERSEFRRRHPFWETGAPIWRTEAALDKELAAVRAAGFASPRPPGRASRPVAAPVWGPGGELVAALGASVPEAMAGGMKLRRVADEVRRAAEELSSGEQAGRRRR